MKFGVFIAMMSRKRHINTGVKADNCDEVTIVLSSRTLEKGKSGIHVSSPKLNDTISWVFQGINFELFNSKSAPNKFIFVAVQGKLDMGNLCFL